MTVFCSCVCVWDGPWKDDRTKYLPNDKGQLSADNTCDFKRSNPTWFFLLFIFCFPPKIMTTVNIHDRVFSLSGSPTSHYSCNHVLHPKATSNFFFFKNRNQPHFRYCPIIFVLIFLLLVILHTLLISSYFIYLFSRSLFAYLFSLVSSMYPVTTGCGKAQFPDRDHLNSPSSPHHQGSILGLHYIVSLIRIYRTVAGRLSSSASESKRCPAVTSFRCVNRQ